MLPASTSVPSPRLVRPPLPPIAPFRVSVAPASALNVAPPASVTVRPPVTFAVACSVLLSRTSPPVAAPRLPSDEMTSLLSRTVVPPW